LFSGDNFVEPVFLNLAVFVEELFVYDCKIIYRNGVAEDLSLNLVKVALYQY